MALRAFTRDGRQLAAQVEGQYASNAELNGVVDTLQPKADMVNYVTNAALVGELESYVTTAALAGTLTNYVTDTALGEALTPYLTQASAEVIYSPKERVVQYETPEVGETVVVNADTDYLLLDPAGPLANITLDFPGSPADQKRFTVASTRNMNSLTINTGSKAIHNPASGLGAGGAFEYMFRGSSNAWFRVK